MATTSKLIGSNGYYGHSGSGEYGSSGVNHLYVGKSSGTSNYRSRLTFPAMSSLEEVGTDRIRITKMILYIRRNESGSATTITAGCSASSAWGASINASASGSIANNTGDYQAVDITALADKVAEYGSKWYLHISGTTPRVRFDGTGKAKKPYIDVTWERVAATITGDKDSAELGSDAVTFTIAPEVEGETHTLTYAIGDSAGTIATQAGNSISWTPPLSLATEILYDTTAPVEVRMTAYDSAGKTLRTETYYQTVTVPASVKPVVSDAGVTVVKALSGYMLAGLTTLKVAPQIDMTGAYGASIASLSATITGGQSIEWTSLTEGEPGVFTAAAAQTNPLVEGTVSLVITVTDSRGRETIKTNNYSVRPYSLPVIQSFKVYRYEPTYDENEEIDGYMPSDVGNYIAVELLAEATSVKPSQTQLNKLSYTIVGENNDTGAKVTGKDVSNDFLDDDGYMANSGRRIQVIFDRDIFPQTYDGDESWTFTATVTDSAGGSAVQYSEVAPGHAALSISPNKHGVAVGMIATGTKAKPKFEVAKNYESHFYGPVYGQNGSEMVGIALDADVSLSQSVSSGAETGIKLYTARTNGLYLAAADGVWVSNSSGARGIRLLARGEETFESVAFDETVTGSYVNHSNGAVIEYSGAAYGVIRAVKAGEVYRMRAKCGSNIRWFLLLDSTGTVVRKADVEASFGTTHDYDVELTIAANEAGCKLVVNTLSTSWLGLKRRVSAAEQISGSSRINAGGAGEIRQCVAGIFRMSVGDSIILNAEQTSGSALNVGISAKIVRIGG